MGYGFSGFTSYFMSLITYLQWEWQGERGQEWERQSANVPSSPFFSLDLLPLWAPRLALHLPFHTSLCPYHNPNMLVCRSSARSNPDEVGHILCMGWPSGYHAVEPISTFSPFPHRHWHRSRCRPRESSVA